MSEPKRTSPLHPEHPKHPDNHPLRRHHPHHESLHLLTGFFFLFVFFVATMAGLLSNAPFGAVIMSFLPAVILGLVVIALANADHLELNYLLLSLLVILVVAAIAFLELLPGVDVFAVIMINFLLGIGYLLSLRNSYSHYEQELGGEVVEVPADKRDLGSLFSDITERSKRINTAIGRVYSVYRGASAGMREKIKIQSSLYNELDPEKKDSTLIDLLVEIQERISLLDELEEDVFSSSEQKKLSRDTSKRVIDVLADVEGEGVLQAQAAARSYVESALSQLR